MPKVLNRICDDIPDESVYVGRPTKWGNPYTLGVHGDRPTVIQMYENYIQRNPDLQAAIPSLRGKDLVCWCAPEACHADVLLKLAN